MSTSNRGDGSHRFARVFRAFRDRWWLILTTIAVAGGAAFAVSSFLEPRYNATAQVAYSQRDADAVTKALTDAGTAGLPKTLANDTLTLGTSAFTERVVQALGGTIGIDEVRSSLEVTVDENVELVVIGASASQAELAASVANSCADEFIKVRQEKIAGLLRSALEFLRGRLGSLAPSDSAGNTGLTLEQYEYALNSLLADNISDYVVLERAAPPTSPYYPRPLANVLVGAAAGLLLGCLLALLTNALGRRVRDRTTLERALDLPTLGVMPTTTGRQAGGRPAIGLGKNSGAVLDSMRTLRTNLKLLGFGDTKRTLLITSTGAGEEKNALAVNLTLSMTLSGDRVILVDADLRHPSVHEYLGISNARGLSDVLSDANVAWSETIQPVDLAPLVDQRLLAAPAVDNGELSLTKFLCLSSGSQTADPAAALGSGALSALLGELQGYSDYVIINGPPQSAVSDSLILARSVDAVIMASTLGKQTSTEVRQVRQLLARAEIEPLGVVLCGARARLS